MKKFLLCFLLLCLPLIAQQHKFPATDTDNTFTGKNQFMPGAILGPKTVATLPTGVVDGTIVATTDGTPGSTPCTGGGGGALAFRIGGQWVCLPTSVSGANANQIQGVAVSATAPTEGQALVYVGNQYVPSAVGGGAGIPNQVVTTDYDWDQTSQTALTAGVQATVTLTPCPQGVDVSGSTSRGGPQGAYPIYIVDGANSEAVYVSGGSCVAGSAGTVIFTPYFSHSPGYTLRSASSGIQEAINKGCGLKTYRYQEGYCRVVIPPNGPVDYATGHLVYDTIYWHANESSLSGYGAVLSCKGRGPCLQVGNLSSANDYGNNIVEGLAFRVPVAMTDTSYVGSRIKSTQRSSGVTTIETEAAHGFRTGDRVTQMFTDEAQYRGDIPSITVVDATHYTYPRSGAADMALHNGPGVAALTFVAVLDNANATHFKDVQYTIAYDIGHFNHFFDFWDDEAAVIDKFNNNAIGLNGNANWTGSFVYSGGNFNLPVAGVQTAPVITIKNSNITANSSNGIQVENSNGVYVYDTVMQATGPWQAKVSNQQGNYQGASFFNIYTESTVGANPISPVKSPWPGLGIAGLLGGQTSGAATFMIRGNNNLGGAFPVVGAGATTYAYFTVAKNVTAGTKTAPMPFMYAKESTPGAVVVNWPRIKNGSDTITYDLLRAPVPAGSMWSAFGGFVAPYNGGCGGGAANACGSVALDIPQCSGFMCTYNDNTSVSTTAYSTISQGTFAATPDFWPGSAVMTDKSIQVDMGLATVGIGLNGKPVFISQNCQYGLAVSGGYGVCLGDTISSVDANIAAMLMPAGAGNPATQTKGRLNFIPDYASKRHFITLVDSDLFKTKATTSYRPLADDNDTWLGLDNPSVVAPNQAQLAMGAPVSITQYIGGKGDNTNWKERLNSTKKEFKVPVKFGSYTYATLPGSAENGWTVYCVDCVVAPTCSAGGTGAMAERIAGVWTCGASNTAAAGGVNGNLQYNNSGALGGFADGSSTQVLHGGRIFGSVTASDADSTIEKTTNKAAANGYASLNASTKVVQDPANAQTTPAASKIPLADAVTGKIADGWLSSNVSLFGASVTLGEWDQTQCTDGQIPKKTTGAWACGADTTTGAPSGTDGQIAMIDGAGGFKVVTGLNWDGTTFHVPGQIEGPAGDASLVIPPRAGDPGAPDSGEIWNVAGALHFYNGTSTKHLAYIEDTIATIASGATALATASIAANSCATVVTVSATGVATTDVISFTPNASIKAVTGYTPAGTLTIVAYPTANNVNFDVCNKDQTNAVTPGAVTLNWRVTR